MNINIDKMISEIEQYLNRQQFEFDEANVKSKSRTRKRGKSALDFFGIDLTEKARDSKLDPIIGRDDQIKRMVTILNRRTKNNPVLIGEPGVGKTAIVEGLAQKIVEEQVPDQMLDKRIVMLDLAGMIAGTKYRGEFEERLKKVMEELTQDKSVIVFVDEMHLLVGAGAAEGAIDAGNILKPALARGAIQVIGATTSDEYTKHIEKDSALERRFQPVTVPESTNSETVAILKGLKKHYEDFHGVEISDEIISDAVELADRYINDRFMPDKAIDLLDEASAHIRIERGKTPAQQRKLMKELKYVTARMESAVDAEDYAKAATYKTRMSQIQIQLDELKKKLNYTSKLTVTHEDLAHVIATMTGVPVKKIIKSEAKFLINLEKHLSKLVVGQEEAVKAVAKAVRRNRSGVGDGRRPIGSFVFLGPTGVGKTELARVLSKVYYSNEDAIIKIDMSEFAERHTVARLVGAPAGYIGFDEGGQLTDKVRRQPHSLILFDEIEKAHPEIFNILLQILEDGYLTDAKGRRVDFTNTIIIMTSNLGAEKLQNEARMGFQADDKLDDKQLNQLHQENSEAVLEELKSLLRPELLNRIDKSIVFKALSKKDVGKILQLQLEELGNRLTKQGLAIKVTNSAKKHLVEEGYDENFGVRPLRRVIQNQIEDNLADGLISGSYTKGDVIEIGLSKKKLTFSKVSE